MAEFPALPLWTDAWVADTHHLSIFARGLYFDLLILMWRTPGCRVPADREWLTARLHISDSVFDNDLKPLIKEFCERIADMYVQKRLQREFEWVRARKISARENAKRRWEKEKGLCQGNAPTPTPIKKESIPPSVEARAPRRAPKTGTRWADGAPVPQEWILMGMLQRRSHGLPEIDFGLEAEKFSNFWSAKTGAQATKLNWRMTWINWILKAEGPRNVGKQTANDKFLAGLAAAVRDATGPAETGGDNVIVGPFSGALLPARLHPDAGEGDD